MALALGLITTEGCEQNTNEPEALIRGTLFFETGGGRLCVVNYESNSHIQQDRGMRI